MFKKLWNKMDLGILLPLLIILGGLAVIGTKFRPATRRTTIDNWEQYFDRRNMVGRPDAPVSIVVFTDLQCPACRQFHTNLTQLLDSIDDVRLSYRHFPLANHNWALNAAIAAECMSAEGKFWNFVDFVFEQQQLVPSLGFSAIADSVGVQNKDQFMTCLDSELITKRVAADGVSGTKLRIGATPTWLIGNKLMEGSPSIDDLRQILESAPRR